MKVIMSKLKNVNKKYISQLEIIEMFTKLAIMFTGQDTEVLTKQQLYLHAREQNIELPLSHI